jgi:hypothetical protein
MKTLLHRKALGPWYKIHTRFSTTTTTTKQQITKPRTCTYYRPLNILSICKA